MRKNRIKWMFAAGLLCLLGFSSCSPKLRPRRARQITPDTIRVIPSVPDTVRVNPDPDKFPPVKLMYGVPPARYELKKVDENPDAR